MPHRADQAITFAGQAGQGAAQEVIGRAGAIDIGGQERADAPLVGVADEHDPAFLGERLAKIHEASAVPGSKSGSSNIHNSTSTNLSNGWRLANIFRGAPPGGWY